MVHTNKSLGKSNLTNANTEKFSASNTNFNNSTANTSTANNSTANNSTANNNSGWTITSSNPETEDLTKLKGDLQSNSKLEIIANNPISNDHVDSFIRLEVYIGSSLQIYSTTNPYLNLNAARDVFENSKTSIETSQILYTLISNSSYHSHLVLGTVILYRQITSENNQNNSPRILYLTLKVNSSGYYAYYSDEPPLRVFDEKTT